MRSPGGRQECDNGYNEGPHPRGKPIPLPRLWSYPHRNPNIPPVACLHSGPHCPVHGGLNLSSLTYPCVTALGEDLEPAGVCVNPRYPSSLPALHADHPNVWLLPTNDPTLVPLSSVSVSPVPMQGLQLGSTLLLPLTSLDLPAHWQSAEPGQTPPCSEGRWGTSTEPLTTSAMARPALYDLHLSPRLNPKALKTGSGSSLLEAKLRKHV